LTPQEDKLQTIKAVHTVVWAFFVMSIFAIPICAALDRYDLAVALICVVFCEVLVLVYNRWRCPLTGVAARYTQDRRHNFDIYLPEFIARFNKQIFGFLYAAGVLFTVIRWVGGLR
jgi:hypothetical protein